MTTNKPKVVAYARTGALGRILPHPWRLPVVSDWSPMYSDALIRLSDYEKLQAECETLRTQRDVLSAHKMAAHQLIGIPASVGVCEPIEGFAERPQDIRPAVRDMALKIERLERERDQLIKDKARLDWIERNARRDFDMSGNHRWWPTSFTETIRGPNLRGAIDAAVGDDHE